MASAVPSARTTESSDAPLPLPYVTYVPSTPSKPSHPSQQLPEIRPLICVIPSVRDVTGSYLSVLEIVAADLDVLEHHILLHSPEGWIWIVFDQKCLTEAKNEMLIHMRLMHDLDNLSPRKRLLFFNKVQQLRQRMCIRRTVFRISGPTINAALH